MVEATKTGKQIVGVEPGREALGIFGMTPIIRDGKILANADVGAAFGKEFVDRAKKRFGIDLAVHSYDGKDFKRLSSTFGDGVVATAEELKGVIAGENLRRDADGRWSSSGNLYRADQELRRPAGRHSRSHQGYHRVRSGGGEFAAQSDPRYGRHPDRRGPAGVAAGPRTVTAIGGHHGGHEPPFRRRNRRHDPGQRAPR